MPLKDYFTMRLSTEQRNYIDGLAREYATSSADIVRTLIDMHVNLANKSAKEQKKEQKGAKYIA